MGDLCGDCPDFRWLERGEGDPVVLLHGLMGRMDHWEEVLDALGDLCRPIALSLPILEEEMPEASIGEVGRFVVRFLDAIDIPRAVIGGNSLGGHVALEMALSHPERVSGLILPGSSGLFESLWRLVTTPASAHRVLRFARAAKRHNVEDRLSCIEVPVLLVWGKDDRITSPEVAERFHALLPDSRLSFLANCGHAPMLEQPEGFSMAVADWLADTQDRRGAVVVGGVR